ncbi:MAG: hypothetical protein ACSHWZ_04945 [Sulfitobacter sp.]
MVRFIPCTLPIGTALAREVASAIMEIILHIGAHRTGTTSFQYYVRDNMHLLQRQYIGFWGPFRTRKGLFAGLYTGPAEEKWRNQQARATGRVKLQTNVTRQQGLQRLLVSDENMMGTPRECMRSAALYPGIGERMARVSAGFENSVTRIVLSIRSQELWWASLASMTVSRGHPLPGPQRFAAIAERSRSWRDVITDLACAVPRAQIMVVPFELTGGKPEQMFNHTMNCVAPVNRKARWMNRSPSAAALNTLLAERSESAPELPGGEGRWTPFSPEQAARLRETYADDIMWLASGADGLAQLTGNTPQTRAGNSLPPGRMTRGIDDDQKQMAGVGAS